MIEWLQNNLASIKREPVNDKENSGSEASDQSEEDEISPEEQAKIDAEMQKKQAKKKGIRAPVCAEVYGEYNKKKDFKPRNIPKTDEQKKSIIDKVSKSFIFNSLEDNELNTVLLAFEEKKYKAGENVITQGEQGDVIYLVDQGELDCEKVFKAGDPPTHLKGK
ncbi:MAG: cyclic nucleotide-binding domain-containing protein [archaeon]|nr:cyclic nucleotide-binding domain-containing protein [archaeon]